MIIPVRCFTCNMVIGSKYKKYLEVKDKHEKEMGMTDDDFTIQLDKCHDEKSPAQIAFDVVGLQRYCCRRHLLSHCDLIDKI